MEDNRNYFRKANDLSADLNPHYSEYWTDDEIEQFFASLKQDCEEEINFDNDGQ